MLSAPTENPGARIVAFPSLKPGRVAIFKDSELIFKASRPSQEFIEKLISTPGAVGYVAPDVKRAIDKQVAAMNREDRANV